MRFFVFNEKGEVAMKRQISLFLALTFLFGVLVSCENTEPTPEKLKKDCTVDYVTVSSSCECGIYNYFNRSVVVLDFRSEFYNESLPKSVTNTVNGVPTVLNYEKSWRNQYSAQSLYSSADEKVSYRYNFDTGKLDYVSINGYDMSAISDFSSEEDYISWCEKVLESYVEVDLDDYVYSCNTLISISHEDAAWNETRGGFISELSDTEKNLIRKYKCAWGCDVCQDVCPITVAARARGSLYTKIPFFCESVTPSLTSELVRSMDEDDFLRRAYSWRGRDVILRNLSLLEDEEKSDDTKGTDVE